MTSLTIGDVLAYVNAQVQQRLRQPDAPSVGFSRIRSLVQAMPLSKSEAPDFVRALRVCLEKGGDWLDFRPAAGSCAPSDCLCSTEQFECIFQEQAGASVTQVWERATQPVTAQPNHEKPTKHKKKSRKHASSETAQIRYRMLPVALVAKDAKQPKPHHKRKREEPGVTPKTVDPDDGMVSEDLEDAQVFVVPCLDTAAYEVVRRGRDNRPREFLQLRSDKKGQERFHFARDRKGHKLEVAVPGLVDIVLSSRLTRGLLPPSALQDFCGVWQAVHWNFARFDFDPQTRNDLHFRAKHFTPTQLTDPAYHVGEPAEMPVDEAAAALSRSEESEERDELHDETPKPRRKKVLDDDLSQETRPDALQAVDICA